MRGKWVSTKCGLSKLGIKSEWTAIKPMMQVISPAGCLMIILTALNDSLSEVGKHLRGQQRKSYEQTYI